MLHWMRVHSSSVPISSDLFLSCPSKIAFLAMESLVAQAWTAFDNAADLPCRVTPAVPILFFGDLQAYHTSSLRVVTVALNPSRHEFPTEEPFQRFPLLKDNHGREPERYLEAMSAYFREDPYREWFQSFEPLLHGPGASYYGNGASTVLHTEICSPITTDPTWSKLDDTDREALEKDGGPLFHRLLEALCPQIVVLSVAKRHRQRIGFVPRTDGWKPICAFPDKKDGSPRRYGPYEIHARWYGVSQQHLFVFGQARTKPLADLTNPQKKEAGGLILKEYHRKAGPLPADRRPGTCGCPSTEGVACGLHLGGAPPNLTVGTITSGYTAVSRPGS